ncbi:MAG: hypothetical protein KAR44_10395 [Candidatus Aegiribacteria sp.]|nr:hypothetical protein [Candidatus Aegiribacteria sp.]
MRKVLSKVISHPVISGLIVFVIGPSLIAIIKWGFTAVVNWIFSIPELLFSTIILPIWLFIILLITSITGVVFGLHSLLSKRNRIIEDYLWDTFFGVTWRWYQSDLYGLINLKAFCPEQDCDMELKFIRKMITASGRPLTYYSCPNCGKKDLLFDGTLSDLKKHIEKLIERNIREIENGISINKIRVREAL